MIDDRSMFQDVEKLYHHIYVYKGSSVVSNVISTLISPLWPLTCIHLQIQDI